jgi:hypothetical protein
MTTPPSNYLPLAAMLASGALALQACGDAPPPVQLERPPELAEPATGPADDPAGIAARLVANALSVPLAEITLVSVEARNFGDPSLGCPEPGMSYPQVITPGHRVVVEADGRRFDVRVAGTHGRICRKPAGKGVPDEPGAAPPRPDAPITSHVDRARADLAAQLQLDATEIDVIEVRPYAPGIAAPGCNPACDRAHDGCGYLVGLSHDGRRYDYLTAGGSAVSCPPLSPI